MNYFKQVGWDGELPFNRLKGMAMSLKYPIIVAWANDDMKQGFEPKPLWYGYDDEYVGIWRILDINIWEEYRKSPISVQMKEEEEICEEYYSRVAQSI